MVAEDRTCTSYMQSNSLPSVLSLQHNIHFEKQKQTDTKKCNYVLASCYCYCNYCSYQYLFHFYFVVSLRKPFLSLSKNITFSVKPSLPTHSTVLLEDVNQFPSDS